MLHLPYTSVTAALLSALLIYLSLGVIRLRRRHRIAVHDGGDKALTYAIRAQGNLAEYAPLWLGMYALLEAQGAAGWFLGVLGTVFVVGRVMHAYSLRVYEHINGSYRIRFWGMIATLTSYGVAIFALLAQAAGF